MRSVVESSESIHISHWLKPFALVFHSHPIHGHAHCCLSVLFLLTLYFLLYLFFLLFHMVDNDSMTMNTLCNSANGTFVTLDEYLPDTNVELFESCETIPKVQCSHCLLYWNQGIVYCTCGQSLIDSESERKFNKLRLDALSIPNYVIKKGPNH